MAYAEVKNRAALKRIEKELHDRNNPRKWLHRQILEETGADPNSWARLAIEMTDVVKPPVVMPETIRLFAEKCPDGVVKEKLVDKLTAAYLKLYEGKERFEGDMAKRTWLLIGATSILAEKTSPRALRRVKVAFSQLVEGHGIDVKGSPFLMLTPEEHDPVAFDILYPDIDGKPAEVQLETLKKLEYYITERVQVERGLNLKKFVMGRNHPLDPKKPMLRHVVEFDNEDRATRTVDGKVLEGNALLTPEERKAREEANAATKAKGKEKRAAEAKARAEQSTQPKKKKKEKKDEKKQ